MTRRAIVNVAHGQWYPVGQQRLFDSLEERGESATRLFWRDKLPSGCPEHGDDPYVFKPYAFHAARELGFDQAVWMDASVWQIRPDSPVWPRLDEDGWYLEPDGNLTGNWIGDVQLRQVGITRDQAMEIPLIEGKLIGLDFRNPTASRFLDEWKALADAGAFRGRWNNHDRFESEDVRCYGHRHDIACGSPVAHRLGMRFQERKTVGFPANGDPGDEITYLAQGL